MHERVARLRVLEFGELDEHVGHLVATLAATDVDDDVGVAVLGDRLLGDRLARAEWAGDGGGAAHREREEHVEDAHPGEERRHRVELLLERARLSHWPRVHHLELGAVGERGDHVVDGVLARRDDAFDGAALAGRDEDLVREGELGHGPDRVSGLHFVALRDAGRERPRRFARERVDGDAPVDVRARGLEDLVERALDAVEDPVEHAGPELDGERQTGRDDLLADREAAGVFVDLHERGGAVETDDLTDEVLLADADDVVHPRTHHALGDDRRTRDALDLACDRHGASYERMERVAACGQSSLMSKPMALRTSCCM